MYQLSGERACDEGCCLVGWDPESGRPNLGLGVAIPRPMFQLFIDHCDDCPDCWAWGHEVGESTR